jgi:hypothetical protein
VIALARNTSCPRGTQSRFLRARESERSGIEPLEKRRAQVLHPPIETHKAWPMSDRATQWSGESAVASDEAPWLQVSDIDNEACPLFGKAGLVAELDR